MELGILGFLGRLGKEFILLIQRRAAQRASLLRHETCWHHLILPRMWKESRYTLDACGIYSTVTLPRGRLFRGTLKGEGEGKRARGSPEYVRNWVVWRGSLWSGWREGGKPLPRCFPHHIFGDTRWRRVSMTYPGGWSRLRPKVRNGRETPSGASILWGLRNHLCETVQAGRHSCVSSVRVLMNQACFVDAEV